MSNILIIICVIVLFLMLSIILWCLNTHLENQRKIAIIFENQIYKTNEILEEIRDKLKYNKDATGLLEELEKIGYYVQEIYERPYYDKQEQPINNNTSSLPKNQMET